MYSFTSKDQTEFTFVLHNTTRQDTGDRQTDIMYKTGIVRNKRTSCNRQAMTDDMLINIEAQKLKRGSGSIQNTINDKQF